MFLPRNGNPLQCSCLENPREGGAWWAALYGVAQSRTRLTRLSSSSGHAPHTPNSYVRVLTPRAWLCDCVCSHTPVFLPGKFHGWRSLVGYSPWGHLEAYSPWGHDTTEHACTLNLGSLSLPISLLSGHHDLCTAFWRQVEARTNAPKTSLRSAWMTVKEECREGKGRWTVMMNSEFVCKFHAAKWLQSCPTLCDPIEGSPPGSPLPGILQARTLEWVAISRKEHNSTHTYK